MKKTSISLSPSTASRWTRCTASPRLIADNLERLPPGDTIYNVEGTKAHQIASHVVRETDLPAAYDRKSKEVKTMLSYANEFVEQIQDVRDLYRCSSLYSELQVPLYYMRDRHGYIDAHVITDNHLFIFDYKYGQGIIVDAVENKQMAIYAMSLIKQMYPWFRGKVTMIIFQPRGRDRDDKRRSWTTTLEGLKEFCQEHIDPSVQRILNNDSTEYYPDDSVCTFCPAVSICSARAKQLMDIVPDGDATQVTPVEDLSYETLVRIVQNESLIRKYLDEVYKRLYHLACNHQAPGWKIVEGRRGNRQWKDEKLLAKKLTKLIGDKAFTKKLLSPAQMEKLVDIDLTQYITRNEGKPILVPETDKRPALTINPEDEFDLLT